MSNEHVLTVILPRMSDTSLQKSQYAKRFGRVNQQGVRHLTKLEHYQTFGKSNQ